MSIARPAASLMRGALRNDLKRHVLIATVISGVAALGYKLYVNDWRKAKYQEFFK